MCTLQTQQAAQVLMCIVAVFTLSGIVDVGGCGCHSGDRNRTKQEMDTRTLGVHLPLCFHLAQVRIACSHVDRHLIHMGLWW